MNKLREALERIIAPADADDSMRKQREDDIRWAQEALDQEEWTKQVCAKQDAKALAKRRERIVTAALQGLLANTSYSSYKDTAKAAVKLADALMAELDKESEE